MIVAWIAIGLLAGAALSIQAGANSVMAGAAGGALTGTLISFAVGGAALAAMLAAGLSPWPSRASLAAPWWAWLGGLYGVTYVASSAFVAPSLGAASFAGLVVAGQMIMAVLLDHYGAGGFAEHAVTPLRLLGIALVITGVVTIRLT